jgi:hypothetical protein
MIEEIKVTLIRRDADDWNQSLDKSADTEYSSFAAHWERQSDTEETGHPVGVWVRYGPNVSHKSAFLKLSEGIWEALQDPEGHDISVQKFLASKEWDNRGNPPPYATIDYE